MAVKMKKTATLGDISGQTGFSLSTVSMALRGSKKVSPETTESIQRAATELGYVPNYAARQLAAGRSGIVGLYAHSLHYTVWAEVVNRLLAELNTDTYRPVLGVGAKEKFAYEEYDPAWHKPWMDTFQRLNVDALIMVTQNAPLIELPDWANNIPVIMVGVEPDDSLKTDYIALDRADAGRMAVDYLLQKGRRKIYLPVKETCELNDGAMKALQANGLSPYDLEIDASERQSGFDWARELGLTLARHSAPPDAIFGFGSESAVALMSGLVAGGLRVPEDVAVIGYDYNPVADVGVVPLTTVEQPVEQIVAETVATIGSRMGGNDETLFCHKTLAHRLVIRESA